MRHAVCFHLEGALLDHRGHGALPGVGRLLGGLARSGRRLIFSTAQRVSALAGPQFERRLTHRLQPLLGEAGLNDAEVRRYDFTESQLSLWQTSRSQDRAAPAILIAIPDDSQVEAIRGILASGVDKLVVIDDRPDVLVRWKEIADPRITVIGFIGSRANCPKIAAICSEARIPLALSAVDLADTIDAATGPAFAGEDHRALGEEVSGAGVKLRSVREAIALVPGLDHPCSSGSGGYHRLPVNYLLHKSKLVPSEYEALWRAAAWIRCSACPWKLLVRSVIKAAGLKADELLAGAYKAYEHTEALVRATPGTRDTLLPHFTNAVAQIRAGVEEIGAGAESARHPGVPFQPGRLTEVLDNLRVVYGRAF